MTRERDFDALARAWLAEGPVEAPDRVVVAVLQAVESSPQERRPIRWLTRRFPAVNRLTLAAAIAAVVAIVVGGGTLFLSSSQSGPGVGSTPSPSAAAPPSSGASAPSAGGVPAELQYAWLGDLRDVAGLETDRSALEITESQVSYAQLLDSDVSSTTPGQLTLTAREPVAGCERGDVGTYEFSLSPGGNRLTLAAVDDACTARSEALAGEWLRSDCRNADNWCLGPLEPGDYSSYFFAPRIATDAAWAPEFGALRYTVPRGWAATSDYPREYFIEPIDWYQSDQYDFSRETRGIYVGSHVAPYDEVGGCGAPVSEDVEPTADGLAAWVAAHPGLDAGEPEDVTIGGLTGRRIDAAADGGWSGICSGAPSPVAILFGEVVVDADAEGRQWGAKVGERNRYIFLDLEEGTVLIEIAAQADIFDELLPEAMQIVESFRFE